MVELDPFKEHRVVAEVPSALRVGAFGDCEEGGSMRSHVVICEESLRGSSSSPRWNFCDILAIFLRTATYVHSQ